MGKGMDKLNKLLGQPNITEIMINGAQATWLEIEGKKRAVNRLLDLKGV